MGEGWLRRIASFFRIPRKEARRDKFDVQWETKPSPGINRRVFNRYLEAFLEGVEHIQEKYGVTPNAIVVTDKILGQAENGWVSPYYHPYSGTIYIPRQFIENMLSAEAVSQAKTNGEALRPMAMATMYGVEEAYHHCQYTLLNKQLTPNLHDANPHPMAVIDPERFDPVERDAFREVQEALSVFRGARTEEFAALPIKRSPSQRGRR